MITIIPYLGALILVGLAAFCVIGAIHAMRRLSAQHEAWRYRERLAEIIQQVESDPASPPRLRSLVAFLADHAFDEQLMRDIAMAPLIPNDNGHSLRAELVADCGIQATMAMKALELFANTVLVLTDSKHHLRIRAARRRQYDQQEIMSIQLKLKNMFAPEQALIGNYHSAFGQ
jgi:hypothetical protein